ncbi:S26 family signal peptidase [Phenylobacterium sp.]|jgi:conjugative transfer signal peptidase TraF|uniref:S26 family signal peptidase n=1 Tax=Phenylobacterium sp. TaxID=1871053 RepID=UPI002E345F30|nr:S26 family signal peptidase [Phenylobacterium sp.]HEX4711107.1 S26 family signal peptidase [Phenylobacterium sp.]
MTQVSSGKGVLALIGITLGLVAIACIPRSPATAVINESPSLPRGLYLRAPGAALEPGAVVAISQPAAARRYLAGLGMPSQVRLLKRVAAAGGDAVCAAPGRVSTPGRTLPVPARDRRGEALPAWRGCRALTADELFLLGDTPNSFDSRYFGPVNRATVQGVYRAAVTW